MFSLIIILLMVFISGATILSIELTSIHILTPYFGNSSIIWTNIIGMFIFFLALGYHFGGIISDKYNSKKLFFSIPIIAGTLLIGAYALINKITKLYFLMIPVKYLMVVLFYF